jgi:hypothetical protein
MVEVAFAGHSAAQGPFGVFRCRERDVVLVVGAIILPSV